MRWTFDDQRHCLQLVRQGKTYAEIAKELGRSTDTVSRYICRMRKLDPRTWRRRAARPGSKQICWTCRFASRPREDGWLCPWASKLQPVEGWEATEVHREIYSTGNIKEIQHTYSITGCPHYEEG